MGKKLKWFAVGTAVVGALSAVTVGVVKYKKGKIPVADLDEAFANISEDYPYTLNFDLEDGENSDQPVIKIEVSNKELSSATSNEVINIVQDVDSELRNKYNLHGYDFFTVEVVDRKHFKDVSEVYDLHLVHGELKGFNKQV